MYPAGQMAAPSKRAGMWSARAIGMSRDVRATAHEAGVLPEALRRDWAELVADASEPNCFCEPWFIAASLAAFEGQSVRIAEVRKAGRLIGVMPLAVEDVYGRIPVRFIQNWCHHQMFLGTPLVRAGEERGFWEALLDLLDHSGWAPNFLHIRGLAENGPLHRALVEVRAAATVHRERRALLESGLSPAAYLEQAVRGKKRKELRRQRNRLAELGALRLRTLERAGDLAEWTEAFLALERTGWKGEAGSALGCAGETDRFFRETLQGAQAAGRLQVLRLDLDDRPIAMLVNFLAAPGSFSFKTAYDEEFARFSPGVLIQIENLAILERADIAWMDSCAAADHPMIDGLWTGRRDVIRVTVRLSGIRRTIIFAACRAVEGGWAAFRRLVSRIRA